MRPWVQFSELQKEKRPHKPSKKFTNKRKRESNKWGNDLNGYFSR
jgi:hypothetical protein